MSISTNYRTLAPADVPEFLANHADAWKDENIPSRQYELVVKPELAHFANGGNVAPYTTLIRCLGRLTQESSSAATTFLDAGAGGGYYREVMRTAGFQYDYTGLDFSPAFQRLAQKIYPDMQFDLGDVRKLPYSDESFDIVMSSAVMMHAFEYEKVFAESVRVSRRYVLLARTPVFPRKPTTFFAKEAYGVECLEIHFNEAELVSMFEKYGMSCIYSDSVFFDTREQMGHRAYVLEKDALFHISA